MKEEEVVLMTVRVADDDDDADVGRGSFMVNHGLDDCFGCFLFVNKGVRRCRCRDLEVSRRRHDDWVDGG
jgi:hypothetical protein